MRPMRLMLLVVLTFTSAVLAGLPNSSAHAQGKGTGMVINGVRDTGQFLPDTTWMVQVGPRVSTIHDFIERFFNSYGEDRPNVDSLGRIQFLNSMIDRDVLGMTVVHQSGGSVFLRAWGDHAASTLKLTEARGNGVGTVAWRAVSVAMNARASSRPPRSRVAPVATVTVEVPRAAALPTARVPPLTAVAPA